jgi:hypothetical protein
VRQEVFARMSLLFDFCYRTRYETISRTCQVLEYNFIVAVTGAQPVMLLVALINMHDESLSNIAVHTILQSVKLRNRRQV